MIFRQLTHERNELRKYITDICKSLDIDTGQSVLGANCLEFYAVLSSTAVDKAYYMEGYIKTVENARDEFHQELKRKEQECEKLKLQLNSAMDLSEGTLRLYSNHKNQKYKQALDEIKENIKALNNEYFYNDFCDCNDCDMKGGCSHYRKSIILNIINKVKNCE